MTRVALLIPRILLDCEGATLVQEGQCTECKEKFLCSSIKSRKANLLLTFPSRRVFPRACNTMGIFIEKIKISRYLHLGKTVCISSVLFSRYLRIYPGRQYAVYRKIGNNEITAVAGIAMVP